VDASAGALAARLSRSATFSSSFPTAEVAEAWARTHLPQLLDRRRYLDCEPLTDDAMSLEWGKGRCELRT